MYADDTQIYLSFKSAVLGDMERSRVLLESCIFEIQRWMLCNNLKLNSDKTEFLVLHSKNRPRPSLNSIDIGESPIIPTESVRNIGVIFDSKLNFEKHVNDICKVAFYHIRNIAKIRKFLSYDTTKTLMHAFVTSRIDCCNALLYGLPNYLIQRLQYVLNSAARVVSLSRRAEHVTPLLIKLHWLPVGQRIIFKILLLTYKIVNNMAPAY